MASSGAARRRKGRRGDQPPGVLEAPGMDGAVPVRSHHPDDPSALRRHARGSHHDRESFGGPYAAGHRFSSLVSDHGNAADSVESVFAGARALYTFAET